MTVYDVFRKTADRYADRPFLHIPAQATVTYHNAAIELSYSQALTRIETLRDAYEKAGYGLGQRIALALDNRMEMFLHFLALNSLGVSIVPVNSGFMRDEMAYVIEHSDACLVVSLPEYVDKIQSAVELITKAPPVQDCGSFERLVTATGPVAFGTAGDDSETAMLYTSGTTGKPKGCMLSNHYFTNTGRWYVEAGDYIALEPGQERLITPLPLVHMNALASSFMGMVTSGGCIIQLDRFHGSSWWTTVRESRASCLHYLGVMPAMLLNSEVSIEDDFSRQIKFGFGAGVDPKHQERFEKRFGFPLIEGWAMTETGASGCIMATKEPRHVGTRCFGMCPSWLEFRIVDDGGHNVANGEAGELLVRTRGDDPRKGFFSGYYKNLEATNEAWAGGYFHTGDVVRQGEDSSFHFVDRKKNVIRRSGENIAAVEVEGALFQNPLVENCAVAPVDDDIRGDEVMACIKLRDPSESGEGIAIQIFSACSELLSYYKLPGYIAFVDDLPTTATQKVRRGEMKKLCKSLIGSSGCFDLRLRKRYRPTT